MEVGNDDRSLEDKLLEAACIGDEDSVRFLLEKTRVNVNASNSMNGWTALHWAAKRGHTNIVSLLLSRGADKRIRTIKGESAADLVDKLDVAKLLGSTLDEKKNGEKLSIVPNYIAYPPMIPKIDAGDRSVTTQRGSSSCKINGYTSLASEKSPSSLQEEIVLKVRVARTSDPDFIEIELPRSDQSYSRLLRVCSEELGVDPVHVLKVRKLPDTIVRKDKDVQRLHNFQELELVLSNQNNLDSRFNVSPFPQSASQQKFTNCAVLY